jgi:elongation factor G
VQLGKVRIACKEALIDSVRGELQFDKTVNDTRLSGLVSLALEPLPLLQDQYVNTNVDVEISSDALRLPKFQSSHEFVQAVKEGIELGLTNGPIRGGKMVGMKVLVKKAHWIDSDSTPTAIRHCTMTLLSQLLTAKLFQLIEPFMSLSIQCHFRHLGIILPDLHSARRATVFEYGPSSADSHEYQVIEAEAPLLELLGYVTWLRSATSGNATLSMNLVGYKPM